MVRQHIDTAPIWEAYRGTEECPLCRIRANTEAQYVESFLGGSVMEPEMRVEVNRKGFCHDHLHLLYDAGNRLGLALMADTHMQEVIARLKKEGPGAAAKGFRFGARAPKRESLAESCILCERLEETMRRYEETVLYMWQHEAAFRDTLAGGKGLCLEHFEHLRDMAADKLGGKEGEAFQEAIWRVTLEGLERVEKDLNWFTLKFDYRNRDKPWGESRDAVERALIKLRGGVREKAEEE